MGDILNGIVAAITGVLSGMGIGGGSLLIIILVSLMGYNQQKAQGINLIYFLPTAASALIIHLKNKNIDKRSAIIISLSGIVTSAAASLLALKMSPGLLKKCFAILVLIAGLSELLRKPEGD